MIDVIVIEGFHKRLEFPENFAVLGHVCCQDTQDDNLSELTEIIGRQGCKNVGIVVPQNVKQDSTVVIFQGRNVIVYNSQLCIRIDLVGVVGSGVI